VIGVLSIAASALPLAPPGDTGTTVDGGDKWVQVLLRRQHPELVVFANLLSAGECAGLMEEASSRLTRSLTVDVKTGGEELNADRTSEGMFFDRNESALVQRVERRIARLLSWPAIKGEGLQVLRYTAGAQYRPHHDYFDPAEPGTEGILKRGGQRVATLIMYLNEPESGGATVFPKLGLRLPPRRGQAVFFSYASPSPDTLTLHGGEPVLSGEKWIATKWLREREFY
jgi:prolyl 4-hydroxylase